MIAEVLEKMPGKPVTTARLAEYFGTSQRDIFKMIDRERREGSPIMADHRGVYIAPSRLALAVYLERRYRRLKKEFASLETLRKTAMAMDGQLELEGISDAERK